MSTDIKTKKRKSGDNIVPAAKKAKTTKSAEKPAPLKSALKKSKVEAEEPKAKKSKTSKKTKPVVEAEEEFNGISDNDSDNGAAELTADQTAALLAGFSSSEDENSDDEEGGLDVAKLPSAPKSKEVQKQLKEAQKSDDPESTPGVIYVGRIPHGFHESQMTAYFSQFGEISRLRLARNKKTGKSKHYAFVEFASAAVADIVARTMDKYLLFGHILQVRTVPAEQVKDAMFKVPKNMKKDGKVRPRGKIEGTRMRKGMEREGWERRAKKELKRREEKKDKMKEMGYEYEMPGLRSVKDVAKKAKAIEGGDVEGGAEEEGVMLIEGKKSEVAPGVEEEVQKVIKADKEAKKVTTKEVRTKRKSKDGAATVTKKKTKVAA